ncbi:APC family permease [Sphingomonas sp. Y38-1Y]|uniref:APC family permease n=1 Tax=Sphingomonas sp. Y38-1Y TaxID=3078265 RepID=UPI0028EE7291|nr:amino acid permease [Sphingomonas sp. Y38-1Y]
MSAPQSEASLGRPRQTLGLVDMLALIVGIVIGAGIFRTPALVAGMAGSELALVAVWVAGGLLSIIGALCYAELAATFPHVGGDYHFLGRAYGERVAFLYGWARLAVIQTGSLALLAYVCGDYLQMLLPLGSYGASLWAGFAVVTISALNWAGIREGAAAQRWLTLAEVGGLVLLIVAGFWVDRAPETSGSSARGSVGLMLVYVLLTYGGWSEAAYLSAEVRGSKRRIGIILVGGLALVTALYVLANLAFVNALGLAGVARSEAVAAEVARAAFGSTGAGLIAAAVAIAALTSANATAITGARTSCAIGRTFPALGWLGRWDERRDTPGNALIAQAIVALILVVAGAFTRDGFALVVDYTAPVFWLFLLLTGLSLFILRRRHPAIERPFRVPLYPVTPAIFCLTTAFLLWSSLAYTGWGALAGCGVLAVGGLLLVFLKPVPEESLP